MHLASNEFDSLFYDKNELNRGENIHSVTVIILAKIPHSFLKDNI